VKTCPHCGYERNASNVQMCSLCGNVFPDAAQKIEREHPRLYHFRKDFAREIRDNKLNSVALIIGFPILLMMLGFAIGIWFGIGMFGVFGALLIGLVLVMTSLYSGDQTILEVSGARAANPDTDQQLINVVDEMRIAAGLPMPKVYVIDSDAANAFATGRDPDTAAVCVTRGLMDTLNRDELQGVIGHEMSHVRNFDIRYLMLVAAMVGAVILLSDLFRRGWWWGGGGIGRRRGRSSGNAVFMLIALLLAILAPLIALLLQMAVSRKREFLADASSVELTRNPLGLASALEKIEARTLTTSLSTASKATQHLFIVNPFRSFSMQATALFSTHPPTEARIRVLRAMAGDMSPAASG
jgi:heat shock protein HtpX